MKVAVGENGAANAAASPRPQASIIDIGIAASSAMSSVPRFCSELVSVMSSPSGPNQPGDDALDLIGSARTADVDVCTSSERRARNANGMALRGNDARRDMRDRRSDQPPKGEA